MIWTSSSVMDRLCSIFGIAACRSLRWLLSHSWANSGLSNRKHTLGQFFDFRFGVNAGPLLQSPTLSKRSAICAILVFRRATCSSH